MTKAQRAYHRAWLRAKFKRDPAYRDRVNELAKISTRRRMENPAYRAFVNERARRLHKRRLRLTPGYRERINKVSRLYMRERYKDPVFRARMCRLTRQGVRRRHKNPRVRAEFIEKQRAYYKNNTHLYRRHSQIKTLAVKICKQMGIVFYFRKGKCYAKQSGRIVG